MKLILACYPRSIRLSPDTKSKDSPKQFRKFQGFHINSKIEVCIPSVAYITKWTIYTCNPDCYVPIEFNQSVIMNTSQLYIRKQTLQYGVYKFELNVTVRDAPGFNLSDFIYVRITQSNIMANLVPRGTSVITSGRTKNLTFNPGEYTDDPGEPFNANVSEIFYSFIFKTYQMFFLNRIGSIHTIVDFTTYTIQLTLFQKNKS